MNIHSTAPTDPDAFLRWNAYREGKRELVNGRVIEIMINATRSHALRVTELVMCLRAALDRSRYEVFAVDFGIKAPAGVRYPDLVVDVVGGSGKDLAVTSPVLVCEVLSPSTHTTDLIEKQREYTGIASVHAYLVLAQDEPRAWLWSRLETGWSGPEEITGEGVVCIPALSLTLALKSFYPS